MVVGAKGPVKVGSGEGNLRLATPPGFTWHLPLARWNYRPEDAELKIGKFYLDFRALSGSVLYTDNAYRTKNNKESGTIGVVSLTGTAMLQVEERFQLAIGGTVAWLPFEGKVGFADPLNLLSVGFTPNALMQLSYDIPVGGWDLRLYDTFSVHNPGYFWGEAFDIFDTDNLDDIDRIGRYSYRIPYDPNRQSYLADRLFDQWIFRNRVGGYFTKVVPTETRLTFGGYHENLWTSGLPYDIPTSRDVLYANADSERENFRFKPFAHYRTVHTDVREGWDHVVYGGVKGPVSDYIDFLGEAGYFWAGNSDVETVLWTLRLDHQIRPNTFHMFQFARNLTYPVESVRTTMSYQLRQVLGRDLFAEVGADRSEYDNVDIANLETVEYRVGARLTYNMTPRLRVRLGGYYRWIEIPGNDIDILTLRAEVNLKATQTIDARLFYQFEDWSDTASLYGYAENLLIFTLTKRF